MANRVSQFTFDEIESKLSIIKDNQGADKCLLGDGTYGELPKGNTITLDETPTENSNNAVKSKGVHAAIAAVNTTVAQNTQKVNQHDEFIINLSGKSTQNTESITALNRSVDTVNTSMQNLTSAVEGINEEIENIQNNIHELTDSVGSVSPTTYNKYVVFAVAGQSNAVGYDESPVDEKFVYKNLDTNRIKQLGFYGDDNLQLINLGYCAQNMQDMRAHNRANGENPGTKGIHLPLANLMLDYIPDDYGIAVLPLAFGGTGFTSGSVGTYDDNLKKSTNAGAGSGTTAQKWGVDTPYYKTLRDRIKHVLNLNENNLFAGIIWCQGENDKANAAGHKEGFEAMTAKLFEELNAANLGSRTPKGTWDKDIWYNMETVYSWYNRDQCQQIWDNYKAWNINTYVEIPRSAESNAINGTGQTASNRPDHYGNNAYQKVVAPRVLQKMIDMNTFAKKVNIIEPEVEIPTNSGGSTYAVATEGTRLVTQNDITKRSSLVFTIDENGNCTADQELQGKFQVNSDEQPCVYFDEIYKMEWEVKRGLYWTLIEGDITGNFLLLGIGGNMTGQLAKIENRALSIIENANTHGDWHYTFVAGDKVRVYRNADNSLSFYRTHQANGIFQPWFEYSNRNIYEKKALGFACGIAGNEFNGNFSTNKNILFHGMKIQKQELFPNNKIAELYFEQMIRNNG